MAYDNSKKIGVGATANDKKGDSLRTAFIKVNNNFEELYTALGLVADADLNLGNFVFESNTVRLTNANNDDSTATQIEIAQPVRIESDLTVGGDIVPSMANGGNLGSLAKPFRSLYVSNSTVFFGGVPLSLEPGTNELRVNNIPVSQSITYTDIPNAPTDVSDLTDTDGLLGGGGGGLPTITVPATPAVLYKGLQASYGMVHSNDDDDDELNVNKIVIHKPAVTTTTIDPSSEDDDFEVSGLGAGDVVAMFVVYGNANEAKPLSDLQAFAEEVIDSVILDDGVAGEFNTVDEMKAAFYANYADLAAAANGLYTDFEFYITDVPTLNGGVTTVRQGSGAIFEIGDNGLGVYIASGIQNNGTNYLPGHKIKVLGTSLGGATPANDCIITVNSISSGGLIFQWSVSGTAAGAVSALYGPVTGTNHNVGSGFTVSAVYKYSNGLDISNPGTNYVVGDVITLLGANLTNGTTPANNITITVTEVQGSGAVNQYNRTGTVSDVWPTNSISDGGADQYDTGNFISTNLANNINYNGGETVVDGSAAFGAGSTYSFVYDTAIFGVFATGSSATLIRTSGGSGADGDSTTEAGNLFGAAVPEQTFDNAVTHINIVRNNPYAGSLVTFTRTDYGDEIDEISEGLHITKNDRGWLYNALEDEGYDDNTPTGSLWNNDGWDDFSNVETRTYTSLTDIWSGNFQNIPGAKMVMLDETTGKYWAIEFLSWTNNQQGGGASYTRQELDLDNLQEGIRFSDGTRQTTAYIDTNVKLTSPGNRRIEEVYGYKSVSVTEQTTVNLTTTASRNSDSPGIIWIDRTTTTIDEIISDTDLAGITDTNTIEFSIDNTNWYVYNGGTNLASDERGYNVDLNGATLTYDQGDTVYFRYVTGGAPVIWWDKDDLPGGSSNFRGAVIDYHAYTDDATIIGTIHIVDDDGDEHITHTEVSSGNTDSENDDLWVVTNEGDIRYRRLDGEANTLKIQWSAKVFYGSEEN